MKFLTSWLLIFLYLVTNTCFAVTISELKPVHPRPFSLPEAEKKQILHLIEHKDWAQQEFQNLQQKAKDKDGYSAAFLYALTNELDYLETAKTWLLNLTKKGGDLGSRALNANADFFNQGMPWLGDVFYKTNSSYLEAFDFIYTGLTESERAIILKGINASAEFRRKSMDAWWQTANLVFKPTSMVAIAGLMTQNPKHLDWGFFRKPESNLGGYFSALNNMLSDNGPWLEAPIYAISHLPLYQSLKVSDYLSRITEQDWFNRKLQQGSSVSGLMNYYINTTYPGELRADGKRDYRILTYGDGATGQKGDYYLVNHNPKQRNLGNELALAYKLSKNTKYAFFLKLLAGYQPNFINKPVLPVSPLFPKAQSSIWPDFGLAFLRSDNSPSYWTNPDAMAASLLFRQGYGHGHADALSITLFGAGQLFYPDYNAVQYENPAIGWTTSSVAHNTVIVDGNNSLTAKEVKVKHEFDDDFRFVQAEIDEPLGLTKKRTLVLTSDYLLDVFHLNSLIPRTYDYLLHSFGRINISDSDKYKTSTPFSSRYKSIKDFKTSRQDGSWQLDFVIDANRKEQNITKIIAQLVDKNNSAQKLKQDFGLTNLDAFKSAKLNFTMSAHPNTLIGIGEDDYGLSFLAARREKTKQTTFAALHSPSYSDQQPSTIRNIETLFESKQGSLLRVISKQYIDLHAISHESLETDLYDSVNATGIKFTDSALIRINKTTKQITTYGQLDSYKLAADIVEMNKDLKSGDYQEAQTDANLKSAPPIQIDIYPKMLVLKNFSDSNFTLSLTNKSDEFISAKIILTENENIKIPQSEFLFNQISPYQTIHQEITLGRYKQTGTVDILPIKISVNNSHEFVEHGVIYSAGPGLIRQFEQETEPVYKIHTHDVIFDFAMRHGFITKITDTNGKTIYSGKSLFDLADGETIYSPRINTIKKSYTWANPSNASLISEVNNQIRWHTLTIQNRFYIKLDPVYTKVNEVFFVFDKKNEKFNWENVRYLQKDKAISASKTKYLLISTNAAEIPFSNSNKSLCIKTTTIKNWINDNNKLSFSLTRDGNDQFGFGVCATGSLTNWAQ